MKSAIFLCFVLFCCANVVRPAPQWKEAPVAAALAPAELEEAEPTLEEIFKRGYGGYYGHHGYGSGAGNVFASQCL